MPTRLSVDTPTHTYTCLYIQYIIIHLQGKVKVLVLYIHNVCTDTLT